MRKIIQIQAVADTPVAHSYIVALCDDGTIWGHHVQKNKWIKVDCPIPQDDELNCDDHNE